MNAFITMRETKNEYGKQIDALEQTYYHFWLKNLNTTLFPLPNESLLKESSFKNIDLIILSGGGSVPNRYIVDTDKLRAEQKMRDSLESKLLMTALSCNIPIIGICRGMQYINCLLGGKVVDLKASHPAGIEHKIVTGQHSTHIVNSFHNDGILKTYLSHELIPVAVDANNENLVEAFRHRTANVLGIQWHPERSFSSIEGYNYTLSLIKGFIKEV